MSHTLIHEYVSLSQHNESPDLFYLWALLGMTGQLTGRRTSIQFGNTKLYGNMYVMLIGDSGVRKSTAINEAIRLLHSVDSDVITLGNKVSSAQALMYNLAKPKQMIATKAKKAPLELEDFLPDTPLGADLPTNGYIAVGELADFFGGGVGDYIGILGELWDIVGNYTYPTRHEGTLVIRDPHVGMIGGITPSTFNTMFPIEVSEQGFLSRLLVVTSEKPDKKFSIPETASAEKLYSIEKQLTLIHDLGRDSAKVIKFSEEVYQAQDEIYKNWNMRLHARLQAYPNRRHTQLLKLIMNVAATRGSVYPTKDDVVFANTLLTYTELRMNRAFGQFGSDKLSPVANTVVDLIKKSKVPVTREALFKYVKNDIKLQDLRTVLDSLLKSDTIMLLPQQGFVPVPQRHEDSSYSQVHVDWGVMETLSPEIKASVELMKSVK